MGYSVVSLYITEPGIEVFPCFVSYFLAVLGSLCVDISSYLCYVNSI